MVYHLNTTHTVDDGVCCVAAKWSYEHNARYGRVIPANSLWIIVYIKDGNEIPSELNIDLDDGECKSDKSGLLTNLLIDDGPSAFTYEDLKTGVEEEVSVPLIDLESLIAESNTTPRCNGITQKEEPCRNRILKGVYCWRHKKQDKN